MQDVVEGHKDYRKFEDEFIDPMEKGFEFTRNKLKLN